MDKNEYRISFLKQSLLGRDIDLGSPKAIITRCIELADKDMMAGGRFVYNEFKVKTREDRVRILSEMLKDSKYKYPSYEKIKNKCESIFWECDDSKKPFEGSVREFRSFGLMQKLINMTFKYLLIFEDDIKAYISEDINDTFKFPKCDCPLDSVILEKLGSETKWTNMTSDDYNDIQDQIQEIIAKDKAYKKLYKKIGNLAYDINWSKNIQE